MVTLERRKGAEGSMPGRLLVELGKGRFRNSERRIIPFVNDPEKDKLLNDIEHTPHAFVLACLMDRQIKAERAWTIPFAIKETLQTFEVDDLAGVSVQEYKRIFREKSLHRFNDDMAEIFYSGVQDIKEKHNGDASRIWSSKPSSAKVVYEFLQFKGCGKKIATMAANLLATQFRIPFADYYSIDISPDVHVLRVMSRTGLVSRDACLEAVIYRARELNPEFPGVIDFSCWEIGRTWCRPRNPNCDECVIGSVCKKVI